MARSPNSEQKLSIEHHGGVLLSAGAGSGKTFVLVEHMAYLLNTFVDDNSDLEQISFRSKLRSYLSSIVMMTFTKKAAGELALRLKARVGEEADSHDNWRWGIIRECISVLTVSTIHGVCHKLLSSGMIPDFDPEIEVATEVDQWEKVSTLLHNWYNAQSDVKKNSDIVRTFISNESSLTDSLVHIFGDPGLRSMWQKLDKVEYSSGELKSFFQDVIKLNELDSLFLFPITPSNESGKGKWKDFLEGFIELSASTPLESVEQMNSYLEFFAGHKGVRKPSVGKVDPSTISYFEKTKELHTLLKDMDESLNAFSTHLDGAYREWPQLFKEIFNYVDCYYRSISGVNFSDLEYYVLKALESDEVVERIARSYKYFIVDEFQDTSYIQYEILSRLVKGDHSKLFCVGDKKQAIYGFRGGELGVFEECSEKINQNLSLVSNYRSKENVINSNNQLFDFLFSKGLGFSGDDPFKVEVEYQQCPLDLESKGKLKRLCVDVEGGPKQKLSRTEMDFIESNTIFSNIKKISENIPGESIAVLYSKLAPSRYLISRLIREDVGFTAQMKVPLSTDPVLGLFNLLVELSLILESSELIKSVEYSTTIIEGYFLYLRIKPKNKISDAVTQFLSDLSLLGVSESFIRFVHVTGISNSNYSNNFRLIQSICKLAAGNKEQILNLLNTHSDGTYSIDFQVGSNPGNIQIMTVHASKGLEFDHVFLGGIHTNGATRSNSNYFGKGPGSFRWKATSSQRKPFKSPGYYLETMISKRKDFAESKRLFYVAATRAVNGLYWCDISFNGAGISFGDHSWVNGIRNWLESIPGTPLSQHIGKEMIKTGGMRDDLIASMSDENTKRPLFHMDSMGIADRASNDSGLATISELSVTRLATLVHCPKKFYLKNICKLEPTDFDFLEIERVIDEKELREEKLLVGVDEIVAKSSAGRGTKIHELVSRSIIEGTNVAIDSQYEGIVSWALKVLSPFSKEQLRSEVPLKFPFFGHTINGIPDLIIEGEHPQVWDFKTGARKIETEESYWFQLMAYGYSQYQLGRVDRAYSIELVLAYLDEKEVVSRSFDYSAICKGLFSVWQKTACFSPRTSHCGSCEYRPICHED